MITIRASTPSDGSRALEIWRRAVHATHDFLTPQDRAAIDEAVSRFLPQAPLWLAVDQDDRAIAFMLLDEAHMEALFIDPPALPGLDLIPAFPPIGLSRSGGDRTREGLLPIPHRDPARPLAAVPAEGS